jgi:hypothetical protein
MQAKQYLSQIKWLDSIIKVKLQQVEELRATATKITGFISLDKIFIQETKPKDTTSELVCKIVDLENEINSHIDKLIDTKREAIRKIELLNSSEYKLLLTLRYISLKSWEEIAVDMHYTFQWIHKIHKKSLIEFEELIKIDGN